LPLVTDVIYEYNMHVVRLEKEKDENRKSALLTDMQEIEAKIDQAAIEGRIRN